MKEILKVTIFQIPNTCPVDEVIDAFGMNELTHPGEDKKKQLLKSLKLQTIV